MALSKEMLDAISKLDNGSAILDQIEADVAEAAAPLKDANAKLLRENVERKRTIQEIKTHLKNAGLDPEAPLPDQLTALTEKVKTEVSKDVTPNKEVAAVKKELDDFKKKFETSQTELAAERQQTKLERVKAAFSPKLPEHFGPAADLILKTAVAEGVITVDETGNPGVKMGDDFFPLNAGNGEKAMNALRQLHPQLAVTKQKGGAGDTGAQGGKGAPAGKTMTTVEYHEKVARGEDTTKFFAEGGQLVD
jgi:hypothetical protein